MITWTLGMSTDVVEHRKGEYTRIQDAENPQLGLYDKPLPCFGCGIGWFSWVLLIPSLDWLQPRDKAYSLYLSLMHLSFLQSSTWIRIPVDVVLCHIPLLWKLLSERSERESWFSCCSDSCKYCTSRIVCFNSFFNH